MTDLPTTDLPTTDHPRRVTRALLSVSDKTGLIEFVRALAGHGIELVSSTVEAEDPEAFLLQIRRAEMSQQLAYSFQD